MVFQGFSPGFEKQLILLPYANLRKLERVDVFRMHALSNSKEEHAHQKKLCATLDSLRHNHDLCDVILWCRGLEFHAHRAVLAAASPYFLDLFLNNSDLSRKLELNLNSVHPDGVTEVLRYIYTGQASVEANNILHVMQVTQVFRMEGMYIKCRRILLRQISADTYTHVWNVGDVLADKYICSDVMEFVTSNLSELRSGSHFKSLSFSRLRMILTDFRVPTDKALETAIIWARKVPEGRQTDVGPLFRALKIESLSQAQLEKVYKNEDLMSEIPTLQRLISCELQNKLETSEERRLSKFSGKEDVDTGSKTFILVFSEYSGQTIMHNYCLEDNTWSRSDISPFDVRVMGTTVLNNLIYCAGGKVLEDDTMYLSSFHVYYPMDYMLQELAPMASARALLSLTAHSDGCLYAVGGFNENGYLPTVERYDVSEETWSTVASLSEPRSGVACVSVNDKLFAVGGRNDSDIVTTVECFTRNSEQWTRVSQMLLPRSHASASYVNGMVYVVGGFWSVQDLLKTSLGSIQCYDPESDSWCLAHCSVPNNAMITASLSREETIYVLTAAGRIYAYAPKEEKVKELRRAPGSKGIMRAAFIITKT